MLNQRFIVSGLSKENSDFIKNSTIATAWERKLLPLRREHFPDHGICLGVIDLRLTALIDEDRDFSALIERAGFSSDIPKELRFIVSDRPGSRLPGVPIDHPLLCAMEIGEVRSFCASEQNPDVLCFKTVPSQVTKDIIRLALDFSYAHSGFPEAVRSAAGLTVQDFLRRKADFVLKHRPQDAQRSNVSEDAPYVSFACLAFCDRSSLSDPVSIAKFVELWDEFLLYILADLDSASVALRYLKKLPKVGGQLPERSISKLMAKLPSGAYIFVFRKKSKHNASKPQSDLMYSTLTSLEYFVQGSVDFGFLRANGDERGNKTLTNLRRLQSEGAVSLVRLVI